MTMQHPALDHKYDIVQFTRGVGVEMGEGMLAAVAEGLPPLYPHFKRYDEPTAAGSLDFVLLCEGPDGERNSEWRIEALAALKPGGYCCAVKPAGLMVMQKTSDPEEPRFELVDTRLQPRLGREKLACVVRYGGFGDMIQASNVLPALHRQGFTVYVMTTPRGQEILQHDPHVDGWLIQDTDQVPNGELDAYWAVQARRFDRFVNLSESVEGTLLAYPGRANHSWPLPVRQRRMGVNYFEWTSELAEVPFAPEARFYPTAAEVEAVDRFVHRLRIKSLGREPNALEIVPPRFNILWTLAGSSVHKMYPHQDDVIRHVLATIPEASFVLCGDYACKLLESGWEDNSRIWCTSGEIGIRDTLALAQRMDCVVGPETGVLNAVGFEPMAKVVMLSHSSAENLTKHWVNCHTITPTGTGCYPCHRLHSDRRFCPEHQPTGASMCAWNTDPAQVYQAIGQAYLAWKAP